jgi:hypothetical protein
MAPPPRPEGGARRATGNASAASEHRRAATGGAPFAASGPSPSSDAAAGEPVATGVNPANPAHGAACDDLERDVLAGRARVRRVFARDLTSEYHAVALYRFPGLLGPGSPGS